MQLRLNDPEQNIKFPFFLFLNFLWNNTDAQSAQWFWVVPWDLEFTWAIKLLWGIRSTQDWRWKICREYDKHENWNKNYAGSEFILFTSD